MHDAELRYTPKGAAVCDFVLASNRFFKQEEETQKELSYFDVSCWTRLAEVCGESLREGRRVRVVGRLKQDRWTGADGKGHSKMFIVAEHVEFKPQVKKADGKDGGSSTEDSAAAASSPITLHRNVPLRATRRLLLSACRGDATPRMETSEGKYDRHSQTVSAAEHRGVS